MPAKKSDQEITVEAEVHVIAADGARKVVRRFDLAWSIALEWAAAGVEKPIVMHFERWARKEEK